MKNSENPPLKRRSEIVRILMYLGITITVQALTYLCSLLPALLLSIFLPVSTAGPLDSLFYVVYLIFWTIGPGIAAIVNGRFTFRVKARWWWMAPLAMMGLGFFFSKFGLPVSNFIIDALGSDFAGLISWGLDALWLILQYVLQRFVLYRKTLDTLHATPDETEATHE